MKLNLVKIVHLYLMFEHTLWCNMQTFKCLVWCLNIFNSQMGDIFASHEIQHFATQDSFILETLDLIFSCMPYQHILMQLITDLLNNFLWMINDIEYGKCFKLCCGTKFGSRRCTHLNAYFTYGPFTSLWFA